MKVLRQADESTTQGEGIEGVSDQHLYRVGNHQPQNVYRGDEYIGVMFSPEDAGLVVQALNAYVPAAGPESFRDSLGDLWTRRKNGRYRLDAWNGPGWLTLQEIIDEFGTHDGA